MVGAYFILKNIRNIVDIEDTLDDKDLELFGASADIEIDFQVYPFTEELPLTGELLLSAQSAALYFVAAKWKAKKENDKLATFYNNEFKSLMSTLIKRLKANPTVERRNKRNAVQTEVKATTLFSQTRKL